MANPVGNVVHLPTPDRISIPDTPVQDVSSMADVPDLHMLARLILVAALVFLVVLSLVLDFEQIQAIEIIL